MRIFGVVPVWSRDQDLAALLDSVARQTRPLDGIVVVDNAARQSVVLTYREHPVCAGADVVRLERNEGAVAGFERGLQRAWQLEADAAWLLDDDSVADPQALERLASRLEGGPELGGTAPSVLFADGTRTCGWHWGSNAAAGHGHSPWPGGPRPATIDWAPFAGLLLRREACEAAGKLDPGFFLWHADLEYCLRITASGWPLLGVPDAEIRHPVYPVIERRVAGRRFAVRQAAEWQEYEDGRNWAMLTRRLQGGPLDDGRPWRLRIVGELARAVAVGLADRQSGKGRVRARLAGLHDGWQGRPRSAVPGAPAAAVERYASPTRHSTQRLGERPPVGR